MGRGGAGAALGGALVALAALAAVAGAARPAARAGGPRAGGAAPGVPRLDGAFLSIHGAAGSFGLAEWRAEFRAMADVGMTIVALRSTVAELSESAPSAECPFGEWGTFFPPPGSLPSACFRQVGVGVGGDAGASTFGLILLAARDAGLEVHTGLAFTAAPAKDPRAWNASAGSEQFATHEAKWTGYAELETSLAKAVWALFGAEYRSTLAGFYTDVEISNLSTFLDQTRGLATRFYRPFAGYVKKFLDPGLRVWASPYFVGNLTRRPEDQIMDPALWAEWWRQIFKEAPDFDFVAPQDAMGFQGNSLVNVSDYLGALREVVPGEGRTLWSNVELFEGWPLSCQWPGPCGRHPAPIERVQAQLANERPFAEKLISWEWLSCLSPHTSADTARLYADYRAYLRPEGA